jgi:hypothetical protein
MSLDGKAWVQGRERFFISVRVMRKLYRGKLLALLDGARQRSELKLSGKLEPLRDFDFFARLMRKVRRKNWVVYAKPPFGGAEQTLKYLARYTHRVAISNHRLQSMDDSGVRFLWRDYRDGRKKTMALSGVEFLRRFSQHILPKRFTRIRHYGLLAGCKRAERLQQCRRLLDASPPDELSTAGDKAERTDMSILTTFDPPMSKILTRIDPLPRKFLRSIDPPA